MNESRLVVKSGENYVNIKADRIFQDENYMYAYKEENLVGIFMIGTFDAAWLSDKPEGRKDGKKV